MRGGGRDSKCAGVQGIAKPKGDCWQTPGISSHSLNSGLGHDGVQQSLNLPSAGPPYSPAPARNSNKSVGLTKCDWVTRLSGRDFCPTNSLRPLFTRRVNKMHTLSTAESKGLRSLLAPLESDHHLGLCCPFERLWKAWLECVRARGSRRTPYLFEILWVEDREGTL